MSAKLDQYSEYDQFCRGPEWRLQLAQQAADRPRVPRELDAVAARAAKFLRLRRRGDSGVRQATERFPEIKAAEALRDQPRVWKTFKLLALADIAAAEIAQRLQLDCRAVVAAEMLYFDVRPLLDSPSLIIAHVINAEADRGDHDLAADMRVSYFAGPFAARALLEAREGLPTKQVDRMHAAALLLYAKFQQAVEMPLNEADSIDYLKLYAQIQFREERLNLDRKKLAFRMQCWARREERRRKRDPQDGQPTDRLTNNHGNDIKTTASARPRTKTSTPTSTNAASGFEYARRNLSELLIT